MYPVGLPIYYKMIHGPYNIKSARNYHYSLRNNPDGGSSLGQFKLRTEKILTSIASTLTELTVAKHVVVICCATMYPKRSKGSESMRTLSLVKYRFRCTNFVETQAIIWRSHIPNRPDRSQNVDCMRRNTLEP